MPEPNPRKDALVQPQSKPCENPTCEERIYRFDAAGKSLMGPADFRKRRYCCYACSNTHRHVITPGRTPRRPAAGTLTPCPSSITPRDALRVAIRNHPEFGLILSGQASTMGLTVESMTLRAGKS